MTAEFSAERHRLEALIEANSADTVSLLQLAHLLHDAHLEQDALVHYHAYTSLRSQNRQAWLDLATVMAAVQDWRGAQSATEALLTHYPDDPSGLYNLGAIFANTGDMQRAEEAWKRVAAQQVDPELAKKANASLERLKSFAR